MLEAEPAAAMHIGDLRRHRELPDLIDRIGRLED
jgi:hypothetical protein